MFWRSPAKNNPPPLPPDSEVFHSSKDILVNGYPHLQAGLDDLVGRVRWLESLNGVNCSWGFTAHAAPLWTAGVSHSSGEILVGEGDLQAALDNFSSRVEFLENVSGVASPSLVWPSARASVAGVSHPASEILVDNFSRLDVALNASFACLDRLEGLYRNSRLKVNGLCGSNRNFCVAGVLNSSGRDAINYYLWTCRGMNGGNDSLCVAVKPVNGSCGVRRNDCLSGFANDSFYPDTSAHFRWRCDGALGGLHSRECRLSRTVSVNGSCGSSNNGCAAGAVGTGRFYVADNNTHHRWLCTGLNGGVNSGVCNITRSVSGSCGSGRNVCSSGVLNVLNASSSYFRWRCDGIGGGRNSAVCTALRPVNGSCGSRKHVCSSGVLNVLNASSSYFRWRCDGTGGGRNSSVCSTRIPCYYYLGGLRNGVYTFTDSWSSRCRPYGGYVTKKYAFYLKRPSGYMRSIKSCTSCTRYHGCRNVSSGWVDPTVPTASIEVYLCSQYNYSRMGFRHYKFSEILSLGRGGTCSYGFYPYYRSSSSFRRQDGGFYCTHLVTNKNGMIRRHGSPLRSAEPGLQTHRGLSRDSRIKKRARSVSKHLLWHLLPDYNSSGS